jgi:Tfp pilus assembly protein FimT
MATRTSSSECRQAGYSIAELALVVAIVAILSAIAIPLFMHYYQASKLGVAAQEVATVLNQGRQMAIKENTNLCVHFTSTTMQYYVGSSLAGNVCDTTPGVWKGPGTDSNGQINASQGVTLGADTDVVFTYLGAATSASNVTVTNSQDGQKLKIAIAISGRINITSLGS